MKPWLRILHSGFGEGETISRVTFKVSDNPEIWIAFGQESAEASRRRESDLIPLGSPIQKPASLLKILEARRFFLCVWSFTYVEE